jgi:hypothetical protein
MSKANNSNKVAREKIKKELASYKLRSKDNKYFIENFEAVMGRKLIISSLNIPANHKDLIAGSH